MTTAKREPVLVLHGGAGTVEGDTQPFRDAMAKCHRIGMAVLVDGGSAVEAVTETVFALERNPLFNAGIGATLTRNGGVKLDAGIMDGSRPWSGSVAGATRVLSPIRAARAVMERGGPVFLIGEDVERFAAEVELDLVDDPSYFITAERRRQLAEVRERFGDGAMSLDFHRDGGGQLDDRDRMGTVGAVALDQFGNLAGATSTGGLTNKDEGRMGDSPIPGAGVWASNDTCAVSCTGTGEAFIVASAASRVHHEMLLAVMPAGTAAESALRVVQAVGGEGGMIVLDRDGRVHMPFSTQGLYRAWNEGGRLMTAVRHDDAMAA